MSTMVCSASLTCLRASKAERLVFAPRGFCFVMTLRSVFGRFRYFPLVYAKRPLGVQQRACLLSLVCVVVLLASTSKAYTPKVNHRTIAGLWKLTQTKTRPAPTKITYPMKEFTVFPKNKGQPPQNQYQHPTITANEVEEKEILLMLKDDGSFQQYANDDKQEDEVHIPDKLMYHASDDAILQRFMGRIKGKWALVDGKLILATDRPVSEAEDTLLIGEVVATSGESLIDNPTLLNQTQKSKVTTFDTHLSIPQGEVNVGKFIYPRHHPSFFEQPMWHPKAKGKFSLKQVLGSLNACPAEEDAILQEKFRAQDFHGKRFLLTSHPLGNRRPKGTLRWSIKYNKFVEDPPSQQAKKKAEEEENQPANIRVMEVQFFSNNTFASCGGIGEAIILRGNYHIVGHDRDQIWMQVWRFGFGRSVSGSVYSEGKTLTKEDEKTYWGKISYEDTNRWKKIPTSDIKATIPSDKSGANSGRRLYVKGSVIFGSGLEPLPVGGFIMSETTESADYDDDNENEEETSGIGIEMKDGPPTDDFVDWNNAFQ